MTDQEIQEAMDVCRPGGEDLRQPEMAALAEAIRNDPEIRRRFERSQRFDAAVMNMFRNIPVPEGLEGRLLAAIEAADIPAAEALSELGALYGSDSSPGPASILPGALAVARSSGSDIQISGASRDLRRKRRRIGAIVTAGLAAAAALVGFVLIPYFGAAEPRADDRLPGEVLAWMDAVVRQGWKTDLQTDQLRARPLDRAVRANPQRWCSIPTPYDSQTVVYDLAPREGDLALVFCMRSRVRNSTLPEIPPWNAFSATGGLTLGVWRHGDMVYVLVVRGGTRRYRELIATPPLIGLLPDSHPVLLIPTA